MSRYIHILVSIPPKMSVSKVYGILRRYSGKEPKVIKEYIANQLKSDQESDQLSMFDPRDPFMGSK